MKRTLAALRLQHRLPDRIIVCPASDEDYDVASSEGLPCPVDVVSGPRGSSAQRNAILAACDEDVLLVMDDDFYPAPDYVQAVEALFLGHPEVVVATNQPLLDGATGPGVSHESAMELILAPAEQSAGTVENTYGGYGCNMSVRLSAVREHGVRFDENLPLYGWLEDIDFSRQLAPYGRIVNHSRLRGVHLATKRGRPSGVKLGYSQIANPSYLVRKGTVRFSYAFRHMWRNVAMNLARSPFPEPWVDRRGRLKGNCLALVDLLAGKSKPSNVLGLSS